MDSTLYQLLMSWTTINTGSANHEGIKSLTYLLSEEYKKIGGAISLEPLPDRQLIDNQGVLSNHPTCDALIAEKHPSAPIQLLLSGHLDTVFPVESSFQEATLLDPDTLQGPGTCDMKAGLLIMLKSLQWLEESPYAGKIGWQAVLTPDEEIGSPASKGLLMELAEDKHVGLIFEPSLPNGKLVSSRKGSAMLAITFRGKASHAGRHFTEGRNAITAMSELIQAIEALTDHDAGITVNVGRVQGGVGANTIPDLAICHLNIRVVENEHLSQTIATIERAAELLEKKRDIEIEVYTLTSRPPKPFDTKTEKLFQSMKKCAKELNMELEWEPSGGVCDGNFLAAAGLPTIDTMGARGDHIHTTDEYVILSSIPEKIELVTCFLKKLALGEIDVHNWRET